MDDFDRFLEIQLRLLLNQLVARRPPPREQRLRRFGRVVPISVVTAETIPVVEPVPVTGAHTL